METNLLLESIIYNVYVGMRYVREIKIVFTVVGNSSIYFLCLSCYDSQFF